MCSVSYQMPRNQLLQIWWRRWLLRPRLLILLSVLLVAALNFIFMSERMFWYGVLILVMVVVFPLSIYRVFGRAIDEEPDYIALKKLEFDPSRLIITTPNAKGEMLWTRFRRFSEDEKYFYLHLSDSNPVSVIPKSAFTPEQTDKFRAYASAANVRSV